ncbi:hypothetical protein C0993_010502 [Termitomyces sp. T159_Od127]|nr:hypothetical protein C0993_010502 [Termitomyces sp. T159_Od127]
MIHEEIGLTTKFKVLKASAHDVRYFAALLRAVNFANVSSEARFQVESDLVYKRATFTVTARGLTITVEEARTLLGTAFIFSDIFDEYSYHSDVAQSSQESDAAEVNVGFEIPLNTLIECLNIFGTAGAPSNAGTKYKKWKKSGNDSDNDGDGDRGGRGRTGGRGLDAYFSGSDRRTGMRLTYAGPGDPLTLILPPSETETSTSRERQKLRLIEKPMLRIQAAGTFGSTEV